MKHRMRFGIVPSGVFAFRQLLCCTSATLLVSCATQPTDSPSTRTNSAPPAMPQAPQPQTPQEAVFSNAVFSGAITFASHPTNETDWKKVAEVFHAKFHEHGDEGNWATKLAEKIGEKVVDKEIEKGYEELRKKLLGGGEIQGLGACCEGMKKAIETVASLQQGLQNSQSEQRKLAEEQKVVLTNLAIVTISNAKMANTLSGISNQFYVAIVLAGMSLIVSVVRLISDIKKSANSKPNNRGMSSHGGANASY